MMKASILRISLPHPRWLRKAIFAGGAWGALVTSGLTALSFAQCGSACIDTTALTAMSATLAGILTFGPLAAFAKNGN